MNCIYIAVLSLILISILGNFSEGTSNETETTLTNSNDTPIKKWNCSQTNPSLDTCPSDTDCEKLGTECLECECNPSCEYGDSVNAICTVHKDISCDGARERNVSFVCQYCYQSDEKFHMCETNDQCDSVADNFKRSYVAQCNVSSHLICLGNREFYKQKPCNWTGGHRWFTALLLSITLGGFGADRFYLGHWQEGIGKLFSFGGLGVWTLVDVVMIAIRYVGPEDGSLYI